MDNKKLGSHMFADELPLQKTAYDWNPLWRNRRQGFNCTHGDPDAYACRSMACSACTKVLRDNLGPQAENELSSGNWMALSLVDTTLRLSDELLANMGQAEFDAMMVKFRNRIRAVLNKLGISEPRIIAGVDFSRDTQKMNGREVDYWWSPHVHGFIAISDTLKAAATTALNKEFKLKGSPDIPAKIEAISDAAGWLGYFLKDPRDMYRRLRYDYEDRPAGSRDRQNQQASSSGNSFDRRPRPTKQSLSEREARPLMELLRRIPVTRRLFLMGYQFQGHFHNGKLTIRHTRTNQGLEQTSDDLTEMPTNTLTYPSDNNGPHTLIYASYLRTRTLFRNLRARNRRFRIINK